MDWKAKKWLCIDTETTGLKPGRDRIVELAAVTMLEGVVIDRRGALVDPLVPIPATASAIHGIYDHEVEGKPTLQEIAERFLKVFEGVDVIVGHNLAYDFRMIEAELGYRWTEAISGKVKVDSLDIVKRMPMFPRGTRSLTKVAACLGIVASGNAHRASADAIMSGQVLWTVRDEAPGTPPDSWII
jgi:DNA polymerase III epsilon subunit family exonuclease